MNDFHLASIGADISEIKSEIKGMGLIIVIFLGIIFFNGAFSSSDKITDYGRQCQQSDVAAKSCTSWTLFSTTYILNKSAEEVVWYDGSGDAVRKNCHIGNTANWYCDLYEGTALEGNDTNIIGFADDKSISKTDLSSTYNEEHFGMYTYWWYKALGWV